MIVEPHQKLDSKESNIISGSIGISSENGSNEVIYKVELNYILNNWDENNNQSHPSSIATTPPEHISLKIFPLFWNSVIFY